MTDIRPASFQETLAVPSRTAARQAARGDAADRPAFVVKNADIDAARRGQARADAAHRRNSERQAAAQPERQTAPARSHGTRPAHHRPPVASTPPGDQPRQATGVTEVEDQSLADAPVDEQTDAGEVGYSAETAEPVDSAGKIATALEATQAELLAQEAAPLAPPSDAVAAQSGQNGTEPAAQGTSPAASPTVIVNADISSQPAPAAGAAVTKDEAAIAPINAAQTSAVTQSGAQTKAQRQNDDVAGTADGDADDTAATDAPAGEKPLQTAETTAKSGSPTKETGHHVPVKTVEPGAADKPSVPGEGQPELGQTRFELPQGLSHPAPKATDETLPSAAAGQPTSPHVGGSEGRPTPIHAVPLEIGLQALAGSKRFNIRLDPAELGRVDVRLDIDEGGTVTAKLTVDRIETLHLLQRDARTLERAFEQAGLKPSDGGVDFSLRDQGGQQGFQQAAHDDAQQNARRARSFIQVEPEIAEAKIISRIATPGRVDLTI